ncbi:DinB family protein [Luteolibacter algae]|uniref:DinB family protein n=1 Tax=Luteolibacter algae TaxID=454151 RepID=A0ABW5DAN9_9BACT
MDLLRIIDDAIYSTPVMNFYGSSLGGHLRHCIDHYDGFVRGVKEGTIDYDSRSRDRVIETSVNQAMQRLESLAKELEREISSIDAGREIRVKMDCGGETGMHWQVSSVGRELQFLTSHTIHHFAMMKGMCCTLGVALPMDFGVAPSTLRYLRNA